MAATALLLVRSDGADRGLRRDPLLEAADQPHPAQKMALCGGADSRLAGARIRSHGDCAGRACGHSEASLMARRNFPYRRLPGKQRGWIRKSSLWEGEDHLLLVRGTRFAEDYRRFYYRDIQAI